MNYTSVQRYLQSVYRSFLSNASDAELMQLMRSRRFVYHAALQLEPMMVKCIALDCEFTRESCAEFQHNYSSIGLLQACDYYTSHFFARVGFWIPASVPYSCGPLPTSWPADLFVGDHTWTEVLRSAGLAKSLARTRTHWVEGGGRGCWFFLAKGSGVFLNVGRSLRVSNRSELIDQFLLDAHASDAYHRDYKQVDIAAGHLYCIRAKERGYDSIQILSDSCSPYNGRALEEIHALCPIELISCHEACTGTSSCFSHKNCTTDVLNSPCIPGLPLRTGVHAHVHCKCESKGFDVLNCAGTRPDMSLPLPHTQNTLFTSHGHRPACSSRGLSLDIKRRWGLFNGRVATPPPSFTS